MFIREKFQKKGVSPVIYINNEKGDKDNLLSALCRLNINNLNEAKQILPLISAFGKPINPLGGTVAGINRLDFTWEREWRYPKASGDLSFKKSDVFVGICPHDEIPRFESLWTGIGFVDPTRNLKWYAKKLIAARQKFDLKFSVI
ncbi:MAG: hypothetical protein IIA17_07890 [candidate division Zixibacteria bacterium]|nr:hypothetical protein [candidate division Zixibacteria bacterium]